MQLFDTIAGVVVRRTGYSRAASLVLLMGKET